MNICSLLEKRAQEHPDRIAIVYRGSSLTYSELLSGVRSTATQLRESGLSHGDRVLIFVPMTIALYVHMLAVLWIGATAAFVDPWMRWKALLAACQKVRPQGFIGIPKSHLLRLMSPAIRSAKVKKMVLTRQPLRPKLSASIPVIEVSADHPALITFTTGSTGVPKAGVRPHGFLIKQHEMLEKYLDTAEGDIDLTILPVFVLHNLALGATSVIPSDVRKVSEIETTEVASLLKSYGVTTSTGSPAFFKRLSRDGIGSTFRSIHVGGAPCFPHDVKALQASMPQTNICVVYGSTEAEPIAEIEALEMLQYDEARGLVAGKPIVEIELRIVRIVDGPIETDDIEKISVHAGEVGEICVAGPHVMTQYLDSPEAFRMNKVVINDRVWHRTGDAGYLDAEGVLYLMGRVEHRIELGNRTIFLLPAEQHLRSLAGVKDGTLSYVNGKLYAVMVADSLVALATIQVLLPEVDEVRMLKALPYDPRHNAKIDYLAIKNILTKAT